MVALNKRVSLVMKAAHGPSQMASTPLEKKLQDQVSSMAQFLREQEELIGTAVVGLEKSLKHTQELEEQVSKLNLEVENARSARNDAQRSLEAVIRDREDLAMQVKAEKAAQEEVLEALELVKAEHQETVSLLAATKEKLKRARAAEVQAEGVGGSRSLRDQTRQLEQDRRDLEAARAEVEEVKEQLHTSQKKLAEGFSDLTNKRQEVLADIEKENSRLSRSWDQIKLARHEVEQHQQKLMKAWEQVEAAKRDSGLTVTPRPSLRKVGSTSKPSTPRVGHNSSSASSLDSSRTSNSSQDPNTQVPPPAATQLGASAPPASPRSAGGSGVARKISFDPMKTSHVAPPRQQPGLQPSKLKLPGGQW
mmetsp:Transcript_36614/g.103378  ORF Transcript_36614/g.103378 Transcript_36614/m.103378 type:complete len:364 (-) Transcript_36614:35-1126(-)